MFNNNLFIIIILIFITLFFYITRYFNKIEEFTNIYGIHDNNKARYGMKCLECSSGKYSSEDATNCISCPIGTFSSSKGQTNCLQCDVGKYQNMAGQTSCLECDVGKYQNMAGQTSCLECDAGKYQDTLGQTDCIECVAGQYSPEGATTCTPCAGGQYSENDGSATCTPCVVGQYSPEGAATCTPCAAGQYSENEGSETCTPCASCPSGQSRTGCGGDQITGGGTSAGTCIKDNVCNCTNGTAASGAACSTDGEHKCSSCNSYFKLDNHLCKPKLYVYNLPDYAGSNSARWGGSGRVVWGNVGSGHWTNAQNAVADNKFIYKVPDNDIESIWNPSRVWYSLYSRAGGGICFESNDDQIRNLNNHTWPGTASTVGGRISEIKVGTRC